MNKAIAERYSCRAYSDEPVSKADIDEIVKAGMRAPSGMNARPWHIIIVRDQALRYKLSQTHQYASFCAQSPVVFVVCGDPEASDHWWQEDCAAVIENMLLQAADLELGTCWIGIRGSEKRGYDREEYVKRVISAPDNIRVSGIIACGHAASAPNPKPAGPMENIHHDQW